MRRVNTDLRKPLVDAVTGIPRIPSSCVCGPKSFDAWWTQAAGINLAWSIVALSAAWFDLENNGVQQRVER
jgi:hypothetical protein